jgi:hypothetical protein
MPETGEAMQVLKLGILDQSGRLRRGHGVFAYNLVKIGALTS